MVERGAVHHSEPPHEKRAPRSPQSACPLDPDGHARRVLEFDKLLDVVVREARTAGGREIILRTVPETDPQRIGERQARVREIRTAFEEGIHTWPLDGVHDLRALLAAAERGSTLAALELRTIAETLQTGGRMRRFLDEHHERLEQLLEIAVHLQEHDEMVQAIHKAVLENGEISDVASPELERIRRRLVRQRATVLRKLERYLGGASEGDDGDAGGRRGRRAGAGTGRADNDAYVTIRAERYVIPVRADAGKIDGIVHDRSGSGATLFVEPLDVVDANNELQALRDAEVRETQRVLRELTRGVAKQADSIHAVQSTLDRIDAIHAAACTGAAMQAATPSDGETLRLLSARHPLLESKLRERNDNIVPLDLDVGQARALVITGPNTGGKTVVLKTLGLLVLMHQSGFQIPAHPDSQLPIYTRLVADIGDEQSIESAESTFSSHLRHVRVALETATEGQLVLLDEFMAGTDPEEGAALAKVVLRRLVEAGAAIFVTSHLGALKLFAHHEPGLANASMLFDPQRRLPLFRLQTGVPGSSNALETAERLGFDARLLDTARRERGEEAGRVESVLSALEDERRRLEEARVEAEAAGTEAKRVREEAATQLGELTRKRRELVDAARREASDLVSRAQARIERTIRELREAEASREAIRATRDEVEQIRKELSAAEASEPSVAPVAPGAAKPQLERAPRPGDQVWIRSWQREGRLERILDDGRATVRYGNAELMVHVRDLELRSAGEPGSSESAQRRQQGVDAGSTGGVEIDSTELESLELHVRGLDREEATAAVERFLDRALLQGAPTARIVHGKGSGVLRRAVHDLLRQHPRVSEFRLGQHGEGGYGVTIATLR